MPQPPAKPVPYDFRNPPKRPAMRGATKLDALQATFACGFANQLAHHVGAPIEITPAGIEESRFDDFLGSLSSPGCVSVLRFDPPGAQAIFDVSPTILFPMMNRLLGGSCAVSDAIPTRRLTQIERGLALAIIERAAGQLADTWKAVSPDVTVREEELLGDPREARIMPAGEMVSVMRMHVCITDGGLFPMSGTISLCLPTPIVELTPDVPAVANDPQRDTENLTKNLLNASVELRALLAETKLRLSDVLSMQLGDVITTDVPVDAPAQVEVQGKPKFSASPAQFQGNRVIEIIQPDGECE